MNKLENIGWRIGMASVLLLGFYTLDEMNKKFIRESNPFSSPEAMRKFKEKMKRNRERANIKEKEA